MLTAFIRTLACLFLAVVVCVAFLGFLTVSKLKSTVLEPSFYTNVLDENNSYETIQAGLITDIRNSEEVGGLREDLGMDVDEFDSLARDVIPIPYLKTQIDGIITGVTSYLRGETEDPEVYVELGQPIESLRLVSLDYVDRRVESVEQTHPTTPEEYARQARNLIDLIEGGDVPSSAPSLANVPEPLLVVALDQVLTVLSRLEPQAAANLEAHWPQISATALAQPESTEAMKLAARAVASAHVDEAIAEIRTHLDDQDRFDLVEAAAEDSDATREEFVEGVDEVRDPINALQGVGPVVALLVMTFAAVGMALVNLPHRASMILWPGITLMIAGFLAIIVSALLSALLPTMSYEVCADATDFACRPTLDILQELARSMADFPMLPSIALIIIGAIGVTAAIAITIRTATGPVGRRPGNMSGKRQKEGW